MFHFNQSSQPVIVTVLCHRSAFVQTGLQVLDFKGCSLCCWVVLLWGVVPVHSDVKVTMFEVLDLPKPAPSQSAVGPRLLNKIRNSTLFMSMCLSAVFRFSLGFWDQVRVLVTVTSSLVFLYYSDNCLTKWSKHFSPDQLILGWAVSTGACSDVFPLSDTGRYERGWNYEILNHACYTWANSIQFNAFNRLPVLHC